MTLSGAELVNVDLVGYMLPSRVGNGLGFRV